MLWAVFVLCYGARSGFTIAGAYFFSGESTDYEDNRIDFLMYAESVIYSPISGQCLTRGLRRMGGPLDGLVGVLSPMPLDLLVLGLTIVKTFKSKTLLESHPSSPIVGVVFHFGFSSKLIPVSRCEQCCATNFCTWDSTHYASDY